jgi:hypothetical protein
MLDYRKHEIEAVGPLQTDGAWEDINHGANN